MAESSQQKHVPDLTALPEYLENRLVEGLDHEYLILVEAVPGLVL